MLCGGDKAPKEAISGAVKATKEIEANILLVGNEEIILSKIKELYGKDKIEEVSDKLKIYNTTEEILMEDIPTEAIKHKKNSSMVVGFNLLKDGQGDVFISAGNSGALLTGAILLVGRIKGIERPAIAPMLPAYKKGFMLVDAGANTNCRPLNLVQFAQMATIYLKNTYNIASPVIGLLNIGTESTKGNDLMKETYKLLNENKEAYGINFYGNIEGRDVFKGKIDALVTDGFTGNVFLKTVEGMGKFVKQGLTESFKKNIFTMLGCIPALPSIKTFQDTVDYKKYGGALFLGVKKPVVKAHGSSDEELFHFTIKQAEQFVKSNAVSKMAEEFEKIKTNT